MLEDLIRLHAGTPIIVFDGSNAMACDISIRFLIPCLLNHCGKRERHEILEGLQSSVYPALVANQVLNEKIGIRTGPQGVCGKAATPGLPIGSGQTSVVQTG